MYSCEPLLLCVDWFCCVCLRCLLIGCVVFVGGWLFVWLGCVCFVFVFWCRLLAVVCWVWLVLGCLVGLNLVGCC